MQQPYANISGISFFSDPSNVVIVYIILLGFFRDN